MKKKDPTGNILIIKPGAIGDLLQLTPVIRALRGKYPRAGITLIVGSLVTKDLFKYNPRLTEVIVYDKRGVHRPWMSFFKLWRYLWKKKFDIVINFQRSNLRTWCLAAAAIPCRVLVYHKARGKVMHVVDNYLETVSSLVVGPQNHGLELFVGSDDERFAEELFHRSDLVGKTVIALNPGASHEVNRWGIDRFAGLADLLTERLSARVIVIGGPDDITRAEEILALAKSKPLNLAGALNLLQLGAVLKRCSLAVSADTGPLHLATAVGTRVVALFGAADPARTGPVGQGHRVIQATGMRCVPCRSRTCSNRIVRECMLSISAEEVFTVIAGMTGNKSGMGV